MFVALRLGMVCPDCMGPVPLNGIAKTVLCHHCQALVDSEPPLRWFAEKLIAMFWKDPRNWSKSEMLTNVTVSGTRTDGIRRDPACGPCGAALAKDEIHAALAAGKGIACPACAEVATVREADDFVRSIVPHARALVGEAIATELRVSEQPILFSCLQCGGGLAVDGTKRVVVCTYCRASSFIPDSLWLRMHPAARRQWFFVEVG
jgi:DNA-directed RNA polymerase subunit RPC12/RpoP